MILGIDTSGPTGSLALSLDDRIVAEGQLVGARSHLENLVPTLVGLLDSINAKVSDIRGIAIGLGPGTFTGTRIGVSTARALCQVLKVPIMGISSLDVIAAQARTEKSYIVVATDARRNEVYRAIYANETTGPKPISQYETRSSQDLMLECHDLGESIFLIGNGLGVYPDLLTQLSFVESAPADDWEPRAATLCLALGKRMAAGKSAGLDEMVPLYVRPTDAELGATHA